MKILGSFCSLIFLENHCNTAKLEGSLSSVYREFYHSLFYVFLSKKMSCAKYLTQLIFVCFIKFLGYSLPTSSRILTKWFQNFSTAGMCMRSFGECTS